MPHPGKSDSEKLVEDVKTFVATVKSVFEVTPEMHLEIARMEEERREKEAALKAKYGCLAGDDGCIILCLVGMVAVVVVLFAWWGPP